MLSLLVGCIAGILTGLGVGSGGLLVIYLSSFVNTPQLSAQMINLVFFVAASFPATLWNIKKKRIEPLPFCLLTLFAILGILPGVFLSVHLPRAVLRKGFGGLMVILGVWGLCIKKK